MAIKSMYFRSLFQFGTTAIYYDSTGKTQTCQVFIDVGSRDPIVGYDSHFAEIITVVSILLEDVPIPRKSDQLQIENKRYSIVSVEAQDDVIALLHVKKI